MKKQITCFSGVTCLWKPIPYSVVSLFVWCVCSRICWYILLSVKSQTRLCSIVCHCSLFLISSHLTAIVWKRSKKTAKMCCRGCIFYTNCMLYTIRKQINQESYDRNIIRTVLPGRTSLISLWENVLVSDISKPGNWDNSHHKKIAKS